MTEFFNDWYYGQGYPEYQLEWTSTFNGVDIVLGQTTSHGSVDFFEMPVPVRLSGQGKDTLVRLDHIFDGQFFGLEIPFEVESVEIDPDYWLISANNTVERIAVGTDEFDQVENAVTLSPNPFIDQVVIKVLEPQQFIERVIVYSSSGTVYREYMAGDQEVIINTFEWPAGIYFIRVDTGQGQMSIRKLMKVTM